MLMFKLKKENLSRGGIFSSLLLLLVPLACGWALLAVAGIDNYEPLLKTTRYTLTGEMGMGFYDKPGGTEQNVLYLEDGADPSQMPEPQEGERWMHFDKLEVDKPSDGWARVDIGDGGEPLYVEEQYVSSEEAALFEGRQGEGTFLTLGAKNLPPAGWIRLMVVLVYFFLYFPVYIILRWGFDTQEHTRQVIKQTSWMVYAGLVYFVLLYTLKFVCGYNLEMYWFVSSGVLGNTFYSIANMVLGILGCIVLAFLLLKYYETLMMGDGRTSLVQKVGWKGFLLLVFSAYFLLMCVGIVIMLAVIVLGVYAVIVLLPKAMAGVAGGDKKADIPVHNCCASCARYDGAGHCYEGGEVHDPQYQCCGKFQRNG